MTMNRERSGGQPPSFPSEAALQSFLAEQVELPAAFEQPRLRREVPVGGCIPDLVSVSFRRIPDSTIWPNKWTLRHIHILHAASRRPRLHLHSLADRCYESVERLRPLVRDLVRTGALTEFESGALAVAREIASIEAEVVAVEAKLDRWKDALRQAITYKRFADRAVVAMDSAGAPRDRDALREFETAGVGLCAVSTDSTEWLVPAPTGQTTSSPERHYLIASAASSRQTSWSFR